MGDISDNERLSVLEDCVRFSEGVELDDAAIGISSTGGNGWFLSAWPNMPPRPHLVVFLKPREPNLPSLLPGDWADTSWAVMTREGVIESGSIGGR